MVLVTLVPQAALAGDWYRCGDRKVRASCCCPGASKRSEAPSAPAKLQRSLCCDLIRNEPRSLQARTEPSGSRPAAPDLIAVVAPLQPICTSRATSPVPAARATAPPGPEPLYLAHAALLL